MFDLIMDMNQAWAKDAGAWWPLLRELPFEHNDAPAPTYSFDTGSAWMSFALQAQSMGLVTHAMWGVEHDQAPAVLNLGEVYKLQAMVAVGRPGDKQDLPQPLQDREVPSPRKAFSELAFAGQMPSEPQIVSERLQQNEPKPRRFSWGNTIYCPRPNPITYKAQNRKA